MARGLSLTVALRLAATVLLGAGCGVLGAQAAAQALRDPTRPPVIAGRLAAVPGHGAAEWVLQSVLISPQRRYAIINGQVVSPGESVSGAELVAVAESKVLLRTQAGLHTVPLFPDVERRGVEQSANETARHQQKSTQRRGSKDQEPDAAGADR